MAKDPAALFYIDTWLIATAEMKADCRGWYLNLILHQFDKKDLPDSLEELASLAQVRVSEYENFKQVFDQVLKHKFKHNDKGRLENEIAKEILRKRELFKGKRSLSGKMGVLVKYLKNELSASYEQIEDIKTKISDEDLEKKDKQMLKQMVKDLLKLYINGDYTNNINNKEGNKEENENFKKDISKFPLAENVNGLTDIQIGSAQELVRITKRVSISSSDVSDLWKVFKVQNLTGKKWYDSEGDIFSHFLNALKKQEFNIVEEKNNGQPKIKMK